MLILSYILSFFCLILMAPVLILLIQVVAASISRSKATTYLANKTKRPSAVVLMPAHNEALVIKQSIETISPQLLPDDRLVVIADNCTDDTATIARGLGAEVIERYDERQRGKGYALDYGLQHIAKAPPETVVIVDADCMLHEDTLERLILSCQGMQRPIQALYLMETQPNPSLKAKIAAFAWTVKNKVRPLGFKVIGLPCQLMGTGMAFTWHDISQVNLASGHIVEDMKLGVDLAYDNKAPVFLCDAVVTSIFPPSEAATNTQRARWEHGHLSVILNEAPKLLLNGIKRKNVEMLGMVFDLLVPPLALLALACSSVFILSVLFGNNVVITLSSWLLGTLTLAVFLAWFKFGRDIISFQQLCYAPIYALSKIPLYLKFLINRQVEWVRSKRD